MRAEFRILISLAVLGYVSHGMECPDNTPNIIFYPDPTNCNLYYECYAGTIYHMSCPAHLYWNTKTNSCDYAANVDCGDRPAPGVSTATTPSPTTSGSTASTTPNYDPDPQCPQGDDGITFYPDPSDCKQYFECNRGTRFTLTCPNELLYNVDEQACDYPEHVTCVGRSTPVHTTATSTPSTPSTQSTSPSPTTPNYDPDPQCPQGDGNITFYPDPTDCKQYFECNRGVRFTMICPNELLYNVKEQACDYPEHVDCVGRSTPVHTTATATTPSPTTPNYDPNPQCSDTSKNIIFYPDPSDCKNYFMCNRGERFNMTCPDVLLWNVNENACDYPDYVECVGRSTPVHTTTTPSGPTTPTSSPDPSQQCPASSKNISFYPDSTDCKKYYMCNRGNKFNLVCPDQLVYNPNVDACDYPENTDCTGREATSTPQPTTPNYDPNPQCSNTSKNIIFYPDPSDCKSYFMCNRGERFSMMCPDTLLWNVNENACDYPEYVECVGRSTPVHTTTTPSGPITPTPSPDPSQQCPASSKNISFYPDSTDCKKYYMCNRGNKFNLVCPDQLVYNPDVDACDYPENTDCTGRGSTTTSEPTTPNYDPDPQCPASEENIVFYPDPSNCKQYFECNRGTRFTLTCPGELLYNVQEQACDYAEHVDCAGRSTPSETTATPTPSQVTTPSYDPNPQCPNSSQTISFFPDPSDCKNYFMCNRGKRFSMVCPDVLLWNVNENACDYPEYVECSGRSTPVHTTTTPSGPTTPTSSPDPSQQCPDSVKNIVFYPDPTDCKKYYMCNRGTRFNLVCPEDLVYNPDPVNACDYPENTDCSGRETTTPSPVTTRSTATTNTRTTHTPITRTTPKDHPCKDKADGDYAGDPNDCTIFYECENGSGIARPCGNNLNWCQEELTCDYSYKEGCSCYTGYY